MTIPDDLSTRPADRAADAATEPAVGRACRARAGGSTRRVHRSAHAARDHAARRGLHLGGAALRRRAGGDRAGPRRGSPSIRSTTAAPSFTIDRAAAAGWREGDAAHARSSSMSPAPTSRRRRMRSAFARPIDGQAHEVEGERSSGRAGRRWTCSARLNGTLHVALDDGRLRDVEPGAGRMLGLMSVVAVAAPAGARFPRRHREGPRLRQRARRFRAARRATRTRRTCCCKGAAVDIGIAGRTGLATEDYDQTIVVSGNPSGPLAVAGALAAGRSIGAGVLVFSQLFKDQLQGLTRAYYHVTGPWAAPVVERISAPAGLEAAAATVAKPEENSP